MPAAGHAARLMIEPPSVVAAVTACPVAVIAAQAAEAIRLLRQLRNDAALIERLNNDDHSPTTDELADMLSERLGNLEMLASHHQARSRKGALFQVLVCLSKADGGAGEHVNLSNLGRDDARRIRQTERMMVRQLYSVAYAAPEHDLDDDLKLLREWYAPLSYHSLAVAEVLNQAAP